MGICSQDAVEEYNSLCPFGHVKLHATPIWSSNKKDKTRRRTKTTGPKGWEWLQKVICTQKIENQNLFVPKKILFKIFYPTISGVGWNHPLTLFTQIPTPPKRLSPWRGRYTVVDKLRSKVIPQQNQNPWDQRIRSSADRSGGGNSNTYIHGVTWCVYIYI